MNKIHTALAITTASSLTAIGISTLFLLPSPVDANVGFARKTGISCAGCHSDASDPRKEALTSIGITYRTCLYNPTPGRVDCNVQAKNQSQAGTATRYPTPTPPPVYNNGQSNNGSAFGGRNTKGGYGGSAQNGGNQTYPTRPTPAPAPVRKSNGVRDFLLGLLGAPNAATNNGQGNNQGSNSGYRGPNNNGPVNQLNRIFVPPRNFNIGQQWFVSEQLGNGRTSDSTWIKRGGSNVFDATFMDSQSGFQSRDIITYTGIRNGQVSFRRQSTGSIYTGKLTSDGRMVLGGTTNQRARNLTWSGTNASQYSGNRPVTNSGPYRPPARTGGPYIAPVAPPPPTRNSNNTQNTRFRAIVSQKCLEVDKGQTTDGAPIVQFQCDGSDEQSFSTKDRGGNNFTIVAKHSGKCFDVPGGNNANNVIIQQWGCDGSNEQLFRYRDTGGGIINLLTHGGKCLEVPGGTSVDYVAIRQNQCDGSAKQRFTLQ